MGNSKQSELYGEYVSDPVYVTRHVPHFVDIETSLTYSKCSKPTTVKFRLHNDEIATNTSPTKEYIQPIQTQTFKSCDSISHVESKMDVILPEGHVFDYDIDRTFLFGTESRQYVKYPI